MIVQFSFSISIIPVPTSIARDRARQRLRDAGGADLELRFRRHYCGNGREADFVTAERPDDARNSRSLARSVSRLHPWGDRGLT